MSVVFCDDGIRGAPCEHQVHAFNALGYAFAGDFLGSRPNHADFNGNLPFCMELALLVIEWLHVHLVAVAKLCEDERK